MRSLLVLELPTASDLPAGICGGDGTCADAANAGSRCGKLHTRAWPNWEGAHVHLYSDSGDMKRCLDPEETAKPLEAAAAGAAACAAFCTHLYSAGCRAWQFQSSMPAGNCLFFTGGVVSSAAASRWEAAGTRVAWPASAASGVPWIGCGHASPPSSPPSVACRTVYTANIKATEGPATWIGSHRMSPDGHANRTE